MNSNDRAWSRPPRGLLSGINGESLAGNRESHDVNEAGGGVSDDDGSTH